MISFNNFQSLVLKQIIKSLNASVKFVLFHHERYRKLLLIDEIFFVLKACSNIQVSSTPLRDYTLRWVLYDITYDSRAARSWLGSSSGYSNAPT